MDNDIDSEPIKNFREWVKRNQKTGVNGSMEDRPYVPLSWLEEYWEEHIVREVLDSCHIHEDVDDVTEDFLRIFSTLVYIGKPRTIELFIRSKRDDQRLPFSELPDEWPPVFERFLENQWMFCPLEFCKKLTYKRELPARQILPVTYGGSLRGKTYAGDGSSIEKVQIHPECNKMTETDVPVVFKIFKGSEMKSQYKAEAQIYSKVSKLPDAQKHIARHYGSFSFEQTQTRVIILEYTAMGSLVDFFKESPPSRPSDYKILWRELLKLVRALHVLHNLSRPSDDRASANDFHTAIHQDIQPANILVFPHPPKDPSRDESRFNVQFKLADFGLAEVVRVSRSDEHFKIQNQGNLMYSAPECFPNHTVQIVVRPEVTNKLDIWALGAVFSDVLVWSIEGEAGRVAYRKARLAALKQERHFKNKGREAFFHNGEDVLGAVPEYHKKVLQDKRGNDPISEKMSNFILENMLTDVTCRLTANTLMGRADKLTKEMQRESHVDSSGSSQSQPHGSCQMSKVRENAGMYKDHGPRQQSSNRPRTPQKEAPGINRTTAQPAPYEPEPGEAPVDIIYEKLANRKGKSLSLGRALGKIQGKPSIELPEMEHAWSLIKARGGRDQIILIDNFVSMGDHLEKVAKTARVISYVTKVADTDGMDLFFASDTTKPQKHTTSKTVELAIRKMKFVRGKCPMKTCLLNITKSVFEDAKNRIKPTSIYVYTDAVWEDANEVASVIKKAIGHLVEAKEDPTTLMFQFIQFGNDENGGKFLRKLDDECKVKHGDVEYDIVDAKRWYDQVPSIVIGSISPENDNKETATNGQLHNNAT